MNNVELNSKGVNKKIKANILSDEEMNKIGFTGKYYEGTIHEQDCPYWYFCRMLKLSNKRIEISFNVKIPKDGSDISINVLDEDFLQPYDYQFLLSKNPDNQVALNVQEQVERWMKYLQDNNVLTGHEFGEYI